MKRVLLITTLALASACQNQKGASAPAAPATSVGQTADASQVVAKADGITVTQGELDAATGSQKYKMAQELYQTQQNALQNMVADHLLQAEAKKANLTVDELMKKQAEKAGAGVTDKDVDDFYNQNKMRMGGAPLNDALKERIKQHLEQQKSQGVQRAFVEELMKNAHAEFFLTAPDPPTVQVSVDDDPARGPDNAPVTIVEFSDFQCPACRGAAQQVVPEVLKAFEGKIKLVYRDFPLSFHQQAMPAAIAANCAHAQGKFWEMHDALFANQQALMPDDLTRHAGSIGLDATKFAACMKDPKQAEEVQKDMADGTKIGVNATPTFIVNGKMVSGASPDLLKSLVEKALGNT